MILKNFKWFTLLIILFVVAALIVGFSCGGLNLGIDFTGGSLVTVKINEDYDSEAVRQAALEVDGISGDVSVVKAGENMTEAVIRIQNSGSEATEESLALQMVENIQKIYPNAIKVE